MQTTLTYTEEQFKQTIVDSFKKQNVPGVPVPNISVDKINLTVYVKEDNGTVPHKVDKFIMELEF